MVFWFPRVLHVCFQSKWGITSINSSRSTGPSCSVVLVPALPQKPSTAQRPHSKSNGWCLKIVPHSLSVLEDVTTDLATTSVFFYLTSCLTTRQLLSPPLSIRQSRLTLPLLLSSSQQLGSTSTKFIYLNEKLKSEAGNGSSASSATSTSLSVFAPVRCPGASVVGLFVCVWACSCVNVYVRVVPGDPKLPVVSSQVLQTIAVHFRL